MRTWSKILSAKVSDPESRWFWVRAFGCALAVAPTICYVSLLSSSFGEEVEAPRPILEYFAASLFAIVVGYFLMQKGAEEEEKKRIRSVIREVMKEVVPPPRN